MLGGKLYRGMSKNCLQILAVLLFLGVGPLVSCVAAPGPGPALPSAAAAGAAETGAGIPAVPVKDVTAYYERPAPAQPRPGTGLATFVTDNFVGSGRCGVCHELLTDGRGNDMSITGHWRATMMANAAKDPLWQAKVSSEVSRNPGLKKVIEEKCTTCHMPMAWTQAYSGGKEQLLLEDGFLNPANRLHEAAMDGVSCSLCHQIRDENLGEKESFSGKFVIDTTKKPPDREIYGPYQEPLVEVMQKGVGYTPVFGSHTNDGALCATCHTLFTPYVDGAGKVAGEFPEQTVYLEWQNSDFGVNSTGRYDIGENPGAGKICQECHMPHAGEGGVYIARWSPAAAEPKDHFSQHHFVGGNVFMLNILQENIASLGLSASTEKFEDTLERTMLQLQHETAELSLAALERKKDELTVVLRVKNLAGHKFPTGIPSRRAWIHLTLADAAGAVVFESGRPLADGRIAANDADEDPGSYEPHYEEISREDQVQIYEGIMHNTDGEVTYTLMRAARFAKDNRLLPQGMDKATVQPVIGVYGNGLADPDFTGGSDRVIYRMKTVGHTGPFTLKARLLFTAVSYPFVRDLKRDRKLPEVKRFLELYRKADKMPQEIKAIEATIR